MKRYNMQVGDRFGEYEIVGFVSRKEWKYTHMYAICKCLTCGGIKEVDKYQLHRGAYKPHCKKTKNKWEIRPMLIPTGIHADKIVYAVFHNGNRAIKDPFNSIPAAKAGIKSLKFRFEPEDQRFSRGFTTKRECV